MDEHGVGEEGVRKRLEDARRRDFSYGAGEILGSMCTAPHAIAAEAYAQFLETNMGDPGHFKGTHGLEEDYLEMLLRLTRARAGAGGAGGHALFLSGGTESNIVAVAAARTAWRVGFAKQGHPDGPTVADQGKRAWTGPAANIVVPSTGHFSFEKAAQLMDLEVRYAEVDERFRVDPEHVASLIDAHTCLVVGIAGNTEFGAIDPIPALDKVCDQAGVPLHIDAALGGFMLPFLPDEGPHARELAWDFRVASVATITMDPHKMGSSTIPGGVLLARNRFWLDQVAVETPYVTTDAQASILGTRPGAGAAAAWAVATHLGRNGYQKQAVRCMEDAAWFRAELEARGIAQYPTDLNVILVKAREPLHVQHLLGERGWRVNAVPQHDGIRIVVMPHVQRDHLKAFLPALETTLRLTDNVAADDDGGSKTPHASQTTS